MIMLTFVAGRVAFDVGQDEGGAGEVEEGVVELAAIFVNTPR